MKTVIITGSNGLTGSEAVRFYCERGYRVVGIDNDMRKQFFGSGASTDRNRKKLEEQYPEQYQHFSVDIRNQQELNRIFGAHGKDIRLILHTAAQPSHDWAAQAPFTDFSINAGGTLELLEKTRHFCPEAVFIYCSTNKVYGDTPNRLPLNELDRRWELDESHPYYEGIDEEMSIDRSTHSLFGVSKLAADLMVQEYGRYFGLKTAVFRIGCISGPQHAGAKLHGFLSFLMKCTMTEKPYQVLGYKGKQVRDNIHCHDLVSAFHHFFLNPRPGEVYNIGGGRHSHCSMLEAISLCEDITNKELRRTYQEQHRTGDHIWWITDYRKFTNHYPAWSPKFTVVDILSQIYLENREHWKPVSLRDLA